MIQLSYRDAKPIYEQIKDGMRKLVLIGALLPGEAVVPVHELSSKLAINPTAISRAYWELEEEGYLQTGPDGTVFVTNVDRRSGRREELMDRFDCVVEELTGLAVSEEELIGRLGRLMNGGKG